MRSASPAGREAISASTSANTAKAPMMMPRFRSGTPAATSSEPIVRQITSAVPMSGWASSSRQAAPTISSSGLIRRQSERTAEGRAVKTWAA